MNMFVWIAIAVYLVGIVVGSIGIGAYLKPRNGFDKFDFAFSTFMVVLWPVFLALGVIALVGIGLFYGVMLKPIQLMMYFGQDLGKCYGEWRKDCRKRKGQ